MNPTIPKKIHQIWIGSPSLAPASLLRTWKEKHEPLGFEYTLWTESEFADIFPDNACANQINQCPELCGVADIMRLYILAKYGGIFADADSLCIEPIDTTLLENTAFAAFENEQVRPGLIANGTIGFVPDHPLLLDMLAEISSGVLDPHIRTLRAWQVLGPSLLTRFLETGNYPDVTVYPSHLFTPHHFEPQCIPYTGHKKVYAYQYWCTSNQNYHLLDKQPTEKTQHHTQTPDRWVSVLITSYNTHRHYIEECLASIRNQTGHFGMEIVWVNDGSSPQYSAEVEQELSLFEKTTRFCKVVYVRTYENRGVAKAIMTGLALCSEAIVVKMDADDIMLPMRVQMQMDYMDRHPECMLCGAQIQMFRSIATAGENAENRRKKQFTHRTAHPLRITTNELRTYAWFMNHPTICFRKQALLNMGGYNADPALRVVHDYEMLVRFIIKHGCVHNLPEVLLLYRLHEDQLTWMHDSNSAEMKRLLAKLLS